ncbi:DUF1801 domain-containing protein [Cryobacterium lactosi]|nr:DUF1801 domain-containing protein [Cryobacterium lactosi]
MVDRYRSVEEFLAAQPAERLPVIEALRQLVHEADPGAREHIKWNSPSYVVDGVDQATISAQGKDGVRLVLHRGATTTEDRAAASAFAGDPHGLLTWHSDIRASLLISDLADLAGKRDAAVDVVRAWLAPAGPVAARA